MNPLILAGEWIQFHRWANFAEQEARVCPQVEQLEYQAEEHLRCGRPELARLTANQAETIVKGSSVSLRARAAEIKTMVPAELLPAFEAEVARLGNQINSLTLRNGE